MVIAINLKLENTFERGIVVGILRFVKNRSDIWLWMPHANIINQEPPDSVDGVIATQHRLEASYASVPAVNINSIFRAGSYQVCTDNDDLCQMAIDHFRDCNIRQICFLHDLGTDVSSRRLACFEGCCRNAGLFPHVLKAFPETLSCQPEHLVADLMALPKPIGIFLFDDRLAPAMLDLCRDLKIRVPQEVALLGINNDIEICSDLSPALTSIDINQERIGYEAARVMAAVINGEAVSSVTLIPPKEVVWRESTAVRTTMSPDVAKVLDYLHNSFTEPLVMEDLLRQQRLGRRTLEKAFQDELGEAPMHYLRSLRLQRVRFLLRTTDLSVLKISHRCGFPDSNYLCQLFRRHYQSTPLTFRKEHSG